MLPVLTLVGATLIGVLWLIVELRSASTRVRVAIGLLMALCIPLAGLEVNAHLTATSYKNKQFMHGYLVELGIHFDEGNVAQVRSAISAMADSIDDAPRLEQGLSAYSKIKEEILAEQLFEGRRENMIPKRFEVLESVALLTDQPTEGLLRGQVGTIVEALNDDGYEVEFVDEQGVTYAMAALTSSQLLRLHFRPGNSASGDE